MLSQIVNANKYWVLHNRSMEIFMQFKHTDINTTKHTLLHAHEKTHYHVHKIEIL